MSKKPTPTPMFSDEQTLPLFTGTPVPVQERAFIPEVQPRQTGMFACGACFDTGSVGEQRCICEAGQRASRDEK